MTTRQVRALILGLLVGACLALAVALILVWTRPLPEHAPASPCATVSALAEPARATVAAALGC